MTLINKELYGVRDKQKYATLAFKWAIAKIKSLTWRQKTLLINAVALTSLLGVMYTTTSTILSSSIEKAEEQETRQVVKEVLNILADNQNDFNSGFDDWSAWDDTYTFIQDVNQAYIKSNLIPEQLAILKVNLALYINSFDRIVFGTAFDLKNNRKTQIPESLRKHLTSNSLLLQGSDRDKKIAGIVLLPEGAMLIASHPILTSAGAEPTQGRLIFGRYLNADEIKELAKITGLHLTIYRFDDRQMPEDFQAMRSASTKRAISVRPLNEKTISGYALVKDIYNQPALVLRVDIPRDIYKQGQTNLRYLSASLLIVGLLFGVTAQLLGEKLILFHQQRQKSQATNRALLNAIPDAMFRIRVDGTIVDFKAAKSFETLVSVSEFIGRKVGEVLPEEVAASISACVEAALKTGEVQLLEYQLSLEGKSQDYEARIVSIAEDEILAIVRDITDRKQMEKAVRESEEQYRRIIETTSEGVWIIDAGTKTTFANSRIAQMLGYSLEEMLGMSVFAFMDEEWQAIAKRYIDRRRLGLAESHDFKFRRKDGAELWVLLSATPILDRNGQFAGALAMLTDITKRKIAESALKQAEEKYRSIFENVVEGIFQTTVDRRFLTANPMLARIFGYDSPAELMAAITDIDRQLYVQSDRGSELRRLIQEKSAIWGFESQVYRKDGSKIWISENTHALYNASGEMVGYEGTVEDITHRIQAQATIQYQAFHDLLTGLFNRTSFNLRLEEALINARKTQNILAVMFLDMDRFKIINDTLGHAIGDRLLQGFAERVTGCLREDDTVARWGGDEFTLLLPQIEKAAEAGKIAQRILDALKKPFNLEGHELYISSSIGIALYPQDGEDVQTLLKNADAALYRAKEQGRNNYRFYLPTMNADASALLTLENRLHQALERDEFIVYYQPQVNVNTWEITGMEALIRWQHPELGLISPGQFIPLAEENGLIVPIGDWVLQTAIAQNKLWQDLGLSEIRVAVNLSPRQFQEQNLVTIVTQLLSETRLSPALLELEITETTLMQNTDLARTKLDELQAMGVQITMDDFGTGYSSLGYLKKFPFRTIKIAQSFVQDLVANPADTAIISAAIALGRGLNLRVVAEGVETYEQMRLLQSLQCEEMQGYLFSQPLTSVEATKFLQKHWLKTKVCCVYS